MPLPAIVFRRILVATDFSPSSKIVVRYAASLARRYSAKLYLLTVVEPARFQLAGPDALSRALELASEDLRNLQTELSRAHPDVKTEIIVRSGSIVDEILQVAASENADLLGVGTHGRTGASRFLLGSVAQRVFQQALIPVLLVGPHLHSHGWSDAAKHIVFPTDLSSASAYALPWAISLAGKYNAKLTVLHVLPSTAGGILGDLDHEHSDIRKSISKLFAGSQHVHYEIAFLHGPPAEQIVRFAQERSCDRIVFGIRKQHTPLEMLSSSIAYEILSGATCPILSVREGSTVNSPTA